MGGWAGGLVLGQDEVCPWRLVVPTGLPQADF
jgi:hypothetical protein